MPYLHAPVATETLHAHAHVHAEVDRESLLQGLLDRFARLAAPAPVLTAQPEPVVPEGEAAD